jgi:ABC-2 type transport system permease protein
MAWAAPGTSARRVLSLTRKEMLQVMRDPSSIALALVMPVILILLFGYGLSLDVSDVPVAVVMENPTPDATDLAGGFVLSPYFKASFTPSMRTAEEWMKDRKVDAIVRFRANLARELQLGNAPVQVIAYGVDANRARIIQGYAQGVVKLWAAKKSSNQGESAAGPVRIQSRTWYNDAVDSHYFLVPGLVVLIMTLIGALLTSLVMAREWERGTLEALFVTPVRIYEILLGKTVPYFILGMGGLMLTVVAGRYLFEVPLRGSLIVLIGVSSLYLLVALGIGLLISSTTRNQFVASQLALVITFMPAFILSGFIFDIASMPRPVQIITHLLPARYYVTLLQTVFLAGNVWSVILPNSAVLAVMAAILLLLTRRKTQKRLA